MVCYQNFASALWLLVFRYTIDRATKCPRLIYQSGASLSIARAIIRIFGESKTEMSKKEKIQKQVVIKNKKASFDYEFIDVYTAGVVLVGTEIKSLRLGKASLVDAYCYIHKGELWMKNANISEYFYGSYNNHNARRERKLLLNRKELRQIEDYVKTPGITIVPTKMFINERGLAKIAIAVAKGKKLYDKRASLKERDDRREMDRAMKY